MVYSARDNKNIPLENKIDDLFNKKEAGVFVELGANDGFFQSNTAFLEKERNWTGVLIEPSKYNFLKCKENRPCSKVYNYACVSKEFTDTHVYGDWENKNAYGAMNSVGGKRLQSPEQEMVKVEAATLESILEKAEISDIDFLSLDTEGYELEILKGLNLDKFKPKYMLIELYKDQNQIDTISYLHTYNYSLISNFSGYNKKDNPTWPGTHQDLLFKLNDNISIPK